MSNSKFDELLKGIGAGIADVREKLVEEPMWGRSLGDTQAPAETPVAEKSATLSPFQEYARDAAASEKPSERGPKEPDYER